MSDKGRGRRYGVKPRGRKFVANPYIPALGKTFWVGTFADEDEAIRAAIAKIDELARIAPSKETVESFIDRWLTDYPRPKTSTNEHYGYMAKHLKNQSGSKLLREFTRLDARRFAKSKPGAARAMRAMFSDARDEGLIETNPFLGLKITGEGRAQRRAAFEVLSVADVERLAAIAADAFPERGVDHLVTFAAYTGMRGGEIFGLEWSEVDFGRSEIRVARQIHKRRCTLPKNGEPRTIILPPPAAAALRQLDHYKPITMADETGKERPFDLVFRNKDFGPLTAGSLNGVWSPVRVAFGRPDLRFHELRHFCATYLLERFRAAGAEGSSDVAKQLGHTDDGVLVRDRYGHTDDDLARERLKKLFDEPTPLHGVEDDEEAANG
jgi:integrase